jgi:hypothetical protein
LTPCRPVLALQVLSHTTVGSTITGDADANGLIGMPEVLFILSELDE